MEKSNLKILAIDDSEDNLISLKAILSDLLPEARVITTSNGRKGIALATVENPDVILLDIVMPEFDGFEVCQHLKDDENLRSIPVVFLTALKTNRESQIKALEVGAEAFLAKPIEEMHLMAIIRTMVKVKEANEMRRKEQERLSNLIQTRTSELHKESAQRSRMEENLAETNEKLRKSQIALLNILEDLKRQNRARLESEKKYRLLFTQMSEGFALHEVIRDKKGIPVDYLFLEVNNAFEELTGLNASGLVGKSVLDVMPGIEERWITTYGEVALTGKPVTFTQYSGELSKWYHVSAFSPEKGKFATIFTDVTRQMEVEEALRESENKFRGITEQIQDVIYMTDKAGRIVYISPASLEIFGYSQDEMLGKPFTGFLEKSQIPLALKKFRFSMKTNQTERDLILTMKRKDNSLFQGELKATLFFEGNKVLGSLGLIRDITDRIKAERALRETTQKLRDLATYIQEVREEERKEIAQDLHDDLGQKLTAMNIDLSWIACRLPADFPEVSDKLYKVQELLLETVTRVKQISSQLRPSILDDLGIAAAIVWQANEFSARTDTPCIVNILPDDLTMPSTMEIQVFRIVQESLTNIMRHAEATNVMISLIQKESSWRLRIKDNGIGFSQEETAMKQSFGIIGMEERTHLCGGTFSIAGEPDKGTEIIVEIPRT